MMRLIEAITFMIVGAILAMAINYNYSQTSDIDCPTHQDEQP